MNNKSAIWWILGILAGFVLLVSLAANLILAGALAAFPKTSLHSGKKEFIEVLMKGRRGAGKKIVVVDLSGLISYHVPGMTGRSMVEDISKQLEEARKDKNVAAIVLNVDSPGGEITASDFLYEKIKKLDQHKPVIAYFNSVAASGAYYTAMGARSLIANELCITGSIGVLLQTINYQKLADFVGVKTITFKSGEMKDLLNPARPMTEEEEKYVQGLIDEAQKKFLDLVATERNLKGEKLAEIGDGRIVSGQTALKNGLVDDIGYLEDAINVARSITGLGKNSPVVRYEIPFHLGRLLRLVGEAQGADLKIQLPLGTPQLEAGKLYYVSPHLFQ